MSISPVCGQFDTVDVRAQAPEGRPQASAARHFDARFDTAVGDLELVLRQQACRGVLARAVVAGERPVGFLDGDRQVALPIGGGVLGAVGVILQLVVAPAGDAVDGAVADLVAPGALIGRLAGACVELVTPDQLPARRAGIGRLVVEQGNLDLPARVVAVVPEVQPLRAAPVLAEGKTPAEFDLGLALAAAIDAQHALERALVGQRQRRIGRDLQRGQRRLGRLAIRAGRAHGVVVFFAAAVIVVALAVAVQAEHVRRHLKVVEQVRVVRVDFLDIQARNRRRAQFAVDRVAELEQHALAALPLAVAQRLDLEVLLRDARRKGERARRRDVVAVGDRGAVRRAVIDRDLRLRRLAQLDDDVGRAPFLDIDRCRAKTNRQRPHRRRAIDRHVVDVVSGSCLASSCRRPSRAPTSA